MTIRPLPETPEHYKLMCRTYLFEARRTPHRSWAFWLLNACSRNRRKAMELTRMGKTGQGELF